MGMMIEDNGVDKMQKLLGKKRKEKKRKVMLR